MIASTMPQQLEQQEWRKKLIIQRIKEIIPVRGKKSKEIKSLRKKLREIKDPGEKIQFTDLSTTSFASEYDQDLSELKV